MPVRRIGEINLPQFPRHVVRVFVWKHHAFHKNTTSGHSAVNTSGVANHDTSLCGRGAAERAIWTEQS